MAEILTSFAHVGPLNAGVFLMFNGLLSSANVGFVAPFIGQVSRVSINRTDVDACTLNIRVNGAVEAQIATSQLSLVETLATPVAFSEGDVISVENDAGGNQISNVSVNLFMQDTLEIPSPLTVRDYYRVNILGHYLNGIISAHGVKTLDATTTKRNFISRVAFVDEVIDYLLSTRP